MTYASVLFHLDASPVLDQRIDFAVRTARRFEGHLIGISAAERTLFELGFRAGFSARPEFARALEEGRRAARARGAHFQERAEGLKFENFESVVDEDDEIGALVNRSRCCDLVLLGQPDPTWPGYAHSQALLERVVLQSVAPTLVLPHSGVFDSAGSSVLIAWNGSAEAARAVAAAIPMLRKAAKVQLMQCNTPVGADPGPEASVLELPREWLGRHGIRLKSWIEVTGMDVGNALLSRAADLGADMIVMGAWGHARWTEKVLGGATRTMLSTMTVPVLMAH